MSALSNLCELYLVDRHMNIFIRPKTESKNRKNKIRKKRYHKISTAKENTFALSLALYRTLTDTNA